jgi:hypothetical protein
MLCRSIEEMKIEYHPIHAFGGTIFENRIKQIENPQWNSILPRRNNKSSYYVGAWQCSFLCDDYTRRYLLGYVLIFEEIENIRAFVHFSDRNLDVKWRHQELESEYTDVELAKKWCEMTAQEILNRMVSVERLAVSSQL